MHKKEKGDELIPNMDIEQLGNIHLQGSVDQKDFQSLLDYVSDHHQASASHSLQALHNLLSDPHFSEIVPQEVQKQMLNELFTVLRINYDSQSNLAICELIGKLSAKIISNDDNEWSPFQLIIEKMMDDIDSNSRLNCLSILKQFIYSAPIYFQNIVEIIKKGLSEDDIHQKLSAMKCLSAYLKTEVQSISKQLQSLAMNICEAAVSMAEKEKDEKGLQILSQMLESNYNIFRKYSIDLLQMLSRIIKSNASKNILQIVCEIFINIFTKSSTRLRKEKQFTKKITEQIIFKITEVNYEITQAWLKCQEDAGQKEENSKVADIYLKLIDYIIFRIGADEILPFIKQVVHILLNSWGWRHKYAAIMIISQFGEYVDNTAQLETEIAVTLSFLNNDNPKLRYAACHAIGLISDYMNPEFQKQFGSQVFVRLLSLLQNETTPRLISYTAAALTNFIEGIQWDQIRDHMQPLVTMLLRLLSRDQKDTKQNALSALASVVEITKQKYQPFVEDSTNILFEILSLKQLKQIGQQGLKQVKLSCIETLTFIAKCAGIELFRPHLQRLIEFIIQMQTSMIDQRSFDLTSYIFKGWKRLLQLYHIQLGQALKDILPSLFALIRNLVQSLVKVVGTQHQMKKIQRQICNKAINDALQTIDVFAEKCKQLFSPYCEASLQFSYKSICECSLQKVKKTASQCIKTIIKECKIVQTESFMVLNKSFTKRLVQKIEDQANLGNVLNYVLTLKNVFAIQTLFNQEQISYLLNKIMNIFRDFYDVKKSQDQSAQMLDEDQQNERKTENEMSEKIQSTIARLISILFKANLCQVGQIKQAIEGIFFSQHQQNQMQDRFIFGVALISTVVERYSFIQLQKEWESYARVLFHFAKDKYCVIREIACRGIGYLVKNTPSNLMTYETIRHWLDLLMEAKNIHRQIETTKAQKWCVDIIVGSIGRILKAHHTAFDLAYYFEEWLNRLALREDKEQAVAQIQILIDMITPNNGMLLGNHQVLKLKQLLAIYGYTLNSLTYPDSLKKRIKQHILSLQFNVFLNESLSLAWSETREWHCRSITNYMEQL